MKHSLVLGAIALCSAATAGATSEPAVGACVAELGFAGRAYRPASVDRGYSVGMPLGSGTISQGCAEPGAPTEPGQPTAASVRRVRGISSTDAVFVRFPRGFGLYARPGYTLPATPRAVINDAWGQRQKGKRTVAVGLSLARGAVATLRLTRGSVTIGSGRLTTSGALRIRVDRPIGRGGYVLAGVVAYRGVGIPLRFPFSVR